MTRRGTSWGTLGEHAELLRGVTYRKDDAETWPAPGYVPILRATNIDGQLRFEDLVYVPAKYVKPEQMLRQGDIVVAASSGSRSVVGKAAPLTRPWEGSFGAFCFVVRPRESIDARYLAYFMKSTEYRSRISELAAGVNINNLRRDHLLGMTFPLPSPEQQAGIVERIEDQESLLDAGVAALRRADLGCDRMLESTLEAAYRQRLAVSDPRENAWPLVRLADLLSEPLRNGHSAKRSSNGNIRTLTLTAVTQNDFSEAHTKLTYADPDRVADLWLRSGDILVERSNTRDLVGTTALYRGPDRFAVFPDLMIRVRVREEISAEYVALMLKAPTSRRYFRERAQGIAGNMPKIDQPTLGNMLIPFPPRSVQESIVNELDGVHSTIFKLRSDIRDAFRRSIGLRHQLYRLTLGVEAGGLEPNHG